MDEYLKALMAVTGRLVAEVNRQVDQETKCDLSDLGTKIGVVVAGYFSDQPGFDKMDFMEGVVHGISRALGTHDKPNGQ